MQRRNDLSISPTTFSSSHNSPSLSLSLSHEYLSPPSLPLFLLFLTFSRSTRVARRFACPGNYPLYSLISPTAPTPPPSPLPASMSCRAARSQGKCTRLPSTLLSRVRALSEYPRPHLFCPDTVRAFSNRLRIFYKLVPDFSPSPFSISFLFFSLLLHS